MIKSRANALRFGRSTLGPSIERRSFENPIQNRALGSGKRSLIRAEYCDMGSLNLILRAVETPYNVVRAARLSN